MPEATGRDGESLFDPLFGDAAVVEALSPRASVQAMLDVEVALAESEARLSIVPGRAVDAISRCARAELYDLPALAREAASDGNLAIPLVRHLTRQVAGVDPAAAGYVHWGATSQDIIDTATVLQLQTTVPHIAGHLQRAVIAAVAHARRHNETVMAGRTWLQQATPITFGLKAAGWADALDRQRHAVEAAREGARFVQFGGASGTLAALGDRGPAVAVVLAGRLGLRVPDVPWHAHRDRLAGLACALGVACGSCGKIAKDVSLLAQTEVAEAAEVRHSGGGSSTMPHKRNPVSASVALAAATRAPGLVATMLAAMPQEHERGLGGWQAEWEALPDLVRLSAGAARATADALEHLSVDVDRMRVNLGLTRGATLSESIAMALAPRIGRDEAHRKIEQATRRALQSGAPLAEVLIADPDITAHLSRDEILERLTADNYLGAARTMVRTIVDRIAGDGG